MLSSTTGPAIDLTHAFASDPVGGGCLDLVAASCSRPERVTRSCSRMGHAPADSAPFLAMRRNPFLLQDWRSTLVLTMSMRSEIWCGDQTQAM